MLKATVNVVASLVLSCSLFDAAVAPPDLLPSHSPFFVHIRPSCRSPTKNILIDCGDDLLCNDLFLNPSALLALLGGPAIVAVDQHDGVAVLAIALIAKVALRVNL